MKQLSELNFKKIGGWAMVVTLTMIAFYGLGAYKHWKEIKNMD